MEASCPCGSCKLQVEGDPIAVMRCHCEDCRTAGAAKEYFFCAMFPADKVTVLKDDIEPRKTSREVLTRNYCKSCKASVCNDVANDEGKLQRRAIPVQSFQRESPTNEIPPWTVQADIWYSERVVDMKDDIPKWSGWPNASEKMEA